jgi:transposase InsO family protein
MYEILNEDAENENYGYNRMYEALIHKYNFEGSKSKVWRVMIQNGLIHKPKRNPNGLTKADKAAQAADNLLKGDFKAEEPNKKWTTDITQLPTLDGKLYISGIFDCYDSVIVGLTMDDNMRKELVEDTLKQAMSRYRASGVICHSDRGSQYTSNDYKDLCAKLKVQQSMNSAGGRCHDNARCESMWARSKVESFYKVDTSKMRMEDVKQLVFRYFMGYWNNRRICSAIGGVPPMYKRQQYYGQLAVAA